MKITLFIDSLCAGGAQRQLVGLAKLLKEKNQDVSVLVYHKNEFYAKILKENDIKYKYIEKAENKTTRIYHVISYLRNNKPDVLISYLSSPNIIACIAKLFIRNMKLIVSERNTSQSLGKNERIRFYLYRFANKIVPNSFSQEKFIRNNFPTLNNKIYTITNFVDTDYFKPIDKIIINEYPLIISVGRITPQKNILNYLYAIKFLVDKGYKFKAVWYGNTDNNEYQLKCITLINELDLQEYFEFRPATTDILKEYQKADIFCLPSNYEGFPNVICEAMCCGLPILCSDVCDNPQIVKDGVNGFLFNPNDLGMIATQISKMIDMSINNISVMGNCNRKESIEKFSKESFVEKYLNIIQ